MSIEGGKREEQRKSTVKKSKKVWKVHEKSEKLMKKFEKLMKSSKGPRHARRQQKKVARTKGTQMPHLISARDKAPDFGLPEAPKLPPVAVDELDESGNDEEHEFASFQLKLLTWLWLSEK